MCSAEQNNRMEVHLFIKTGAKSTKKINAFIGIIRIIENLHDKKSTKIFFYGGHTVQYNICRGEPLVHIYIK